MPRIDGRANDQLRPVKFTPFFLSHPKGSVLIEQGNTRVVCAVSVVPGVPRWMKEQGVRGGWLTGEYGMLPAATDTRKPRDITTGKPDGRSQEIQRLVGRSLRAIVDLEKLGDYTLYVDCDVLDADGGTRCASITGALVALRLAFNRMLADGNLKTLPLRQLAAAVSVGIVKGEAMLDLCYEEDVDAAVDMNVVMAQNGQFIELQATGEESTFTRAQLEQMLALAEPGIQQLLEAQKVALRPPA